MKEKEQKIGVLTFHNAINYGAVLQTFGLEKYIQNAGYNSEVINYCNDYIYMEPSIKRILKGKNIINTLYYLLEFPFWFSRYKKFNLFLQKINVSAERLPDSFLNYTKIIVGSDQVWNLRMTNFDYTFFLENVEVAKKCSYASSFGECTIPESEQEKVAECLKEFQYISVRETSGKELLARILLEKKVSCVLDPTFLLSRKEWEKILIPAKIRGRYVLIYQLAYSKTLIELAKSLAKKLNCKLVTINGNPRQPIFGKNILTAGPDEWLGLINGAEAVVTNSFHGTVFSIIFEKNFYTELLKKQVGRNDRVLTLLKSLELESRIFEGDFESIQVNKDIDFQIVKKKLSKNLLFSKEYLDKVLKL